MDLFQNHYLTGELSPFLDHAAITQAFCRAHKDWSDDVARRWIDIVLNYADEVDTSEWLEYETLFNFARHLKSKVSIINRKDKIGTSLAPFAVVFVEALAHFEKLPLLEWRIDWYDDEEVMVAFEAAWIKARYAEGENLLNAALEFARQQNFRVRGLEVERFRLLIGIAQFLQEVQGDLPIQLPIHRLAPLLGVGPPTVSNLLFKAQTEGWLELVDGRYSRETKRAKLYRFNDERLKQAIKAKNTSRAPVQVQPI